MRVWQVEEKCEGEVKVQGGWVRGKQKVRLKKKSRGIKLRRKGEGEAIWKIEGEAKVRMKEI